MEFGWQDSVAIGIVLAAAGYLVRLAWNAVARKQATGCGPRCGGCGSKPGIGSSLPAEVVTIGVPGRVIR